MGAERTRGRHGGGRTRGPLAVAAAVLAVCVAAGLTWVLRSGGTEEPTDGAAAPPVPPLAVLLDRIGISRDGSRAGADLDGRGNSLSAQHLAAAGWTPGREVVLLGAPIELPDYALGRPDHVVSDGQRVGLRGRHDAVVVLATATGAGGAAVTGTGRIVYTDGTEEEFRLTVHDWLEGPAGDAALVLPGVNSAAEGGPSLLLGSARLYARSVPADPGREVDHVVLPRTGQGSLHVFAVGGRAADRQWTGTWARAVSGYTEVGPWQDQTLRLAVRTTAGGHRVRIRLENTFAAEPVMIGAASLALRGTGAAPLGEPVPLTFEGRADVSLPAGGQVFSDPVEILLPPRSDVLVSLHLPEPVHAAPVHSAAGDTSYTSEAGSGDRTLDATGAPFTGRLYTWPFLTGVEVLGGPGAVVALGDSITDGAGSTRDAHARWPDVLAARLDAGAGLPTMGVLNAGIAGNRVTRDLYPGEGVAPHVGGVSMLHRAPRDVFAHNGVRAVVVFAGINDLRSGVPAETVAAGLEELGRRARERGLRVFVATLAPCGGEARCTEEVERGRQQVNARLRAAAEDPGSPFDGVWDFDAVLRDPEAPERLLPAYDSGDHLHPGDAGLRALAESVNLYQLVG
ncbi:GDSL-type esterase/lipase family protein [Nocardiopsis algeriensis]|uniref:Lysophospholipase L1-like esterase n=1 Tax=Nocardiopsis algeriensis TaxID=1478215 RepID=A0A841IS82_9ACTN|nr:lysophospholipase L1-like esterase [Nocardiopsis algeriensis]